MQVTPIEVLATIVKANDDFEFMMILNCNMLQNVTIMSEGRYAELDQTVMKSSKDTIAMKLIIQGILLPGACIIADALVELNQQSEVNTLPDTKDNTYEIQSTSET